jgi:hypothetical protein
MMHISKQILTMLALVLPLSVGLSAVLQPAQAQSVVTAIVTDPLTGIALGGMDPVSYFTEEAPLLGKAEHEFVWQNVSWHFASAANRDVFARAPQIYAPQFGGHCAMSAARGFVADSSPRFYALFKQRLYLFYSADNREAFLLSPDGAAQQAEANWVALGRQLSVR